MAKTPLQFEVKDVRILNHAVQQARVRLPEAQGISNDELRDLIRSQVKRACDLGQVYDVKPRSFRGVGKTGTLPFWQRAVLIGDGSTCYVIDIAEHNPDVVVITVLRRTERIVIR